LRLKRFYGAVAAPEPRDPFALIVWENAAYLVDDERRALVFARLRERVGIEPAPLLAAGAAAIEEAIRDGGMQPSHRAEKVLRCALIAIDYADGDLHGALRALDARSRRKLLKRFPGIGDPGVAKVLLFAGLASDPALESNGLRVLERLGVVAAGQPYASAYRAGVAYLAEVGIESAAQAIDAFVLLRHHGRELCKRTNPACEPCPLRGQCAYAREAASTVT